MLSLIIIIKKDLFQKNIMFFNSINGQIRKRKRLRPSRGVVRIDNENKRLIRFILRNITSCLNSLPQITTKLTYVPFKQMKTNLIRRTSLRIQFNSEKNNKAIINELCQQQNIKEFLEMTIPEVYFSYYVNSNDLPFQTSKFISIDQFFQSETEKLNRGFTLFTRKINWNEKGLLTDVAFNYYSLVIDKFLLSIKRYVNDSLSLLKDQQLRKIKPEKNEIGRNMSIYDIWNKKTKTISKEKMEKKLQIVMKQSSRIKELFDESFENVYNKYFLKLDKTNFTTNEVNFTNKGRCMDDIDNNNIEESQIIQSVTVNDTIRSMNPRCDEYNNSPVLFADEENQTNMVKFETLKMWIDGQKKRKQKSKKLFDELNKDSTLKDSESNDSEDINHC